MPADEPVQGLATGPGSRRSADPQVVRDVVGRIARLQPVEDPLAELREGDREAVDAGRARDRGATGASARHAGRLRASTARGQPASVGCSNRSAQRQLDAEGVADARRSAAWRGASGRPARRSCRGRRRGHGPLGAQHLDAEAGQGLLDRRARRHDAPRRRRSGAIRESAWRSTLPLGVSGSAVEDDEGRGDHVARAAARRAARGGAGSAVFGGGHVGDQSLVLRPAPRDQRPRPRRTAGWQASAASTSPSSMRKPRIFTWRSMRPRKLERRRRAAAARGRRCGRGRPGSGEGVGHEALGGQVGPAEIAAGQAGAADAQLAPARRAAPGCSPRVQRRRRRGVGDRPADRERPAARASASSSGQAVAKVVLSVGP